MKSKYHIHLGGKSYGKTAEIEKQKTDRMKVVKFITYKEAEGKEEIGIGGLGGFFSNGMRWNDYFERYNDEGKKLVTELRKAIIANNIRCAGSEHQSDEFESVPLFSNGKVATYSFRAWGDLMAAIWSTEENKDYNYMDFYCH